MGGPEISGPLILSNHNILSDLCLDYLHFLGGGNILWMTKACISQAYLGNYTESKAEGKGK